MCVPACSTDPATAEIYTLSLHDALPICERILLAELGKAALDHLLDDVLRLSAFLRLLHRDRALALDEVGRPVFGAQREGLRRSDVLRNLPAELAQRFHGSRARQGDEHADLAEARRHLIVDVEDDSAL